MNVRKWVLGFGALLLAVLGVVLLGRGGALSLLGAIALALGVAGIVVQLLRIVGNDGKGSAQSPSAPPRRHGFDFFGMGDMSQFSQWASGFVMGVLALLGLFLMSRSADAMFTVFGTLLFLFGIATIVVLVHRATDYSSAASDDDQAAA